jgi:hypothetical protein
VQPDALRPLFYVPTALLRKVSPGTKRLGVWKVDYGVVSLDVVAKFGSESNVVRKLMFTSIIIFMIYIYIYVNDVFKANRF